MSSRGYLTGGMREYAYLCIADRDGDRCFICDLKPHEAKLQLDHADNDPYNNHPSNLHILCQHCNLQLRQMSVMDKANLFVKHSHKSVSKKEREKTEGFKRNSISTEIALNAIMEGRFTAWITEWIRCNGFIKYEDALNGGAYTAGCSQGTIRRYIDKMAWLSGFLEVVTDGDMKIIKLRDASRIIKPPKVMRRKYPQKDKKTGKFMPKKTTVEVKP